MDTFFDEGATSAEAHIAYYETETAMCLETRCNRRPHYRRNAPAVSMLTYDYVWATPITELQRLYHAEHGNGELCVTYDYVWATPITELQNADRRMGR